MAKIVQFLLAIFTVAIFGGVQPGGALPLQQDPSFGSRYPHRLTTRSELRNLFNSRISSVQPASRPLNVRGFDVPFIKHTGVVATLQDGSRHFLHKTPAGTNPGNTAVITSARDMSRKWKVGPEQRARPGVTVGDLVKAPGGNYHWLCSNCWWASNKMMKAATNK